MSKNRENGFTLVELLIAMTIGLIILAALSSTFLIQRKTYDVQEQITEIVQTARAAMDMMSREIRMAGYDPTGSAGAEIITASTNSIRFTMDITGGESDGIDNDGDGNTDEADEDEFGDGDTSDSNEDITYSYDAANLQIDRNTGGGNQPFAENIQLLTFDYLPTTADIQQIKITITARTSKPDPDYSTNSGYRTYTLTSLITPRNLAF